MLIGILTTAFVIVCALMILLILLQKGKGSMGLGNIGGASQMLFGGSGGQDILQKTTWVLAVLFIGGSLSIAILKTRYQANSTTRTRAIPYQNQNDYNDTVPTEE